jgi:hypothetical protein
MLNAFKLETIMKSKVLLQSGCQNGWSNPTNQPFSTPFGGDILLTYRGWLLNGHWDVTETKEFLEAFRRGQEGVLKDYLVYRPIPQACFETSLMCIRKRDAALLYKAHEGHERRYL